MQNKKKKEVPRIPSDFYEVYICGSFADSGTLRRKSSFSGSQSHSNNIEMEQKRTRDSRDGPNESSEADGEVFPKYQKVAISQEEPSASLRDICTKLKQCMELRTKWINMHPQDVTQPVPALESEGFSGKVWPLYDPLAKAVPDEVAALSHQFVDGVALVQDVTVPGFKEFVADYYQVKSRCDCYCTELLLYYH